MFPLQQVLSIVDKFLPDQNVREKIKLELLQQDFVERQKVFQNDSEQIKLLTEESQNESLFRTGWRPFVGWICGFGLAIQFILSPILSFVFDAKFPELDMDTLLTLLMGLLGLGYMRTKEKLGGLK